LLAPDLSAFSHVFEADADHQLIPGLDKSAGKNGPDSHVMAQFLRVRRLSFVPKHGVAGHHRKIRQLRKAVDYALRDPVTEILRFRVITNIREGQDGDGVNASPGGAVKHAIAQAGNIQAK